MLDDEIGSLFSLLGLLEPLEYFITVDHSALWQKHISWAKSGGADLRSYITQRHASSMVFLSCLLAAQINVFFNSSQEITEMRACLSTQRMYTLKYWIGVVIMSDICITILALVNTYTLSKLIASISDSNAHAMLRSSIGSYVAVLPSRFTVAALYLFLLWIAMFIWDIFTGPIHMLFIVMVLLLFFHVIIPLSAFGRLIIHTGAMGRRPVLDVELEKELLPSGLHNSLLIRATDRKRKYKSSATDQYRKPPRSSRHVTTANSIPASTMYGTSCNNQQSHVTVSHRPPRDITLRKDDQDSDDLTMDDEEDHDVDGHNPLACNDGTNTNDIPSPTTFGRGYFEGFKGGHRRIETIDTVGSDNFFFPQPAILNATTRTKDIHEIVQQSMHLSASGADSSVHGSSTLYSGGISMTSGKSNHQSQPQQRHHVQTVSAKKSAPDSVTDDNRIPEIINSPSGLACNISNSSSGHIRIPSSGRGSPRLLQKPLISVPLAKHRVTLSMETALSLNDVDATIRKMSPSQPAQRPFFASSPPTAFNLTNRILQDPQEKRRHPLLLDSPVVPSSSIRPPRSKSMQPSHRRRSSLSRRSAGSILGFIPLPSPSEDELEEDNAIRASLDIPLAPDLEFQERLVQEQKHHEYDPSPPLEAVTSTWLAMQQTRRRSSSAGNVRHDVEEAYQFINSSHSNEATIHHEDYHANGGRSNSSRWTIMDHRCTNSNSILRHSTTRSGSNEASSRSSTRRNMMATIRSHPDEENDADDNKQLKREEANHPQETTRLLLDSGRSGHSDGVDRRLHHRLYS